MSAALPRPPLIAPGHTPATVTDKIAATVLDRTPRWWMFGFESFARYVVRGRVSSVSRSE